MACKKQISLMSELINEMMAPYRRVYNSASKELEEHLMAAGIELPFAIHYEYKLPDGLTPVEFDEHNKKIFVHTTYNDDFYKYLTISPELLEVLETNKQKYINLSNKYADFLKNNNPELSEIVLENHDDLIAFLDGAAFGYGPEEIRYFISIKKQMIERFKNGIKFRRLLGYVPRYVLSPEHNQAIICALELRKSEIKSDKNK